MSTPILFPDSGDEPAEFNAMRWCQVIAPVGLNGF
jgi:hypothetical protein